MSSIQDMNNRMKQNRNLRPSKRAKFKGNNREVLYTESNKEDKPKFKEFSEFQIKKAIDRFREQSKSKKRLELIFLTVFLGVIGTFLIYNVISKKDSPRKAKVNKSRYNYNITPPIMWNGKLSEPLRVPYSDYFYIPMVGNLDYIDLERNYEIHQSNMVVEYTSNILFLDKNCNIINKLLPENGSIRFMGVIPSNKEFKPKKIIYRLTQDEPNVFGKVYNLEKHFLYISGLDGKNLTKITGRDVRSLKWDNQRNEILFYFFYNKRMNDSLHGVFNIESNKFRLVSRQE
ncbi:hypothetical protein [Allomuricauda sp. R78024]|uniref:hypothetical protein n=1 Tax=Allomuricauda sp. R78024 TaxID=3093867 RepID=UPI0037C99CC9